jgi:hypothetical protein
VSVNGSPLTPVDFDLGNGAPLIIYSGYPNREDFLRGRPVSQALLAGAGGSVPAQVTLLDRVSFGGVEFRSVPGGFEPAGGTLDSAEGHGNIGMPLLSRFRIIITDYAHDALWLTPAADAVSRPFDRDRSGLFVSPAGDYLTVTFVAPGSPAERGGWQVGDEILAVDGQPISPSYQSGSLWRWRGWAPGTRVELTMRNGIRRSLVLANYY